ncbi:MAG: hypothetical protein HC906_10365 [Bacteroidales bacterium]|nr:hypothetical protein [Bacteroidales bacterium]
MPFLSSGSYSNFKYISDSRAKKYNSRYTQLGSSVTNNTEDKETYNVDEGGVVAYSFDNPDFNVLDFNSNLVVRWEYKPGSTLFVVWAQNRSDRVSVADFSINKNVKDLFSVFPGNIFLIKFSYRFGLA